MRGGSLRSVVPAEMRITALDGMRTSFKDPKQAKDFIMKNPKPKCDVCNVLLFVTVTYIGEMAVHVCWTYQ